MENALNADVTPQLSSSLLENTMPSIDGPSSSSPKTDERSLSPAVRNIVSIKKFLQKNILILMILNILLGSFLYHLTIYPELNKEIQSLEAANKTLSKSTINLSNKADSLTYELNTALEQLKIEQTEQFVEQDFASKDAPWTGNRFDTSLVKVLYQLELLTGEKIHINSAYRTRSRNLDVGGAEKSMHMAGKAVDIRCLDEEYRYSLIKGAMQLGIDRIGIHPRFIHLDIGDGERVWIY